MRETKIRWADHSWNPMTGCTHVSPGCDHCYADTIASKFAGTAAFPVGFEPTFKPKKLGEPAALLRKYGPGRIFVNSMSDVHHEAFTFAQIADVYDRMLATPEHDYLVLTKRPERMAAFFLGNDARRKRNAPLPLGAVVADGGYLGLRGLDVLPDNIWLGTSIESQRYDFRAEWLCMIPTAVHFLSVEPMLGPVTLAAGYDRWKPGGHLTSLPGSAFDAGVNWVIVGGESGPGYRPMDHDWARTIRDECDAAGCAFYFKQSSAPRTEMGIQLDGRRHEEYPFPHPSTSILMPRPRVPGRYPSEALRLAS